MTIDTRQSLVEHPRTRVIHKSWDGRLPACNARSRFLHHVISERQLAFADKERFCVRCFGLHVQQAKVAARKGYFIIN